MLLSYHTLRSRFMQAGLLPASKLALVNWYLLLLDVVLYALQKVFGWFRISAGASLGGWVSFLSLVVIVLFATLGLRWLKAKLLWRLRNRLIVTYIFIGVIPVILLVALALGSFYLFAGQFATFIVTTGLDSDLKSLQAANSAIAHELSARLQRGTSGESAALEGLRRSDAAWSQRQVCVWLDDKMILNDGPSAPPPLPALPAYVHSRFHGVVRDHGQLFLRAAEVVPASDGKLTVLSSEPLNQSLLEGLATNLGEVTLYSSGFTLRKVDQTQGGAAGPGWLNSASVDNGSAVTVTTPGFVLDTGKEVTPTSTAGAVPPAARTLDRQVIFFSAISVVDWDSGDTSNLAAISVQTRISQLYQRLFESLGAFAPAVESSLLMVAIVFGVIEAAALLIGLRLNRTITGAVAQLYAATQHVNRGDFSHRIPVRSNDQLATLAGSFNLMTESIEKLIEEQKAKQRLENELVIAQEVQAQLYPQHISQMASLEVFGFCRPARTVSGDYYDFLAMAPDKLLLAVGDVSGKGISAALLMATIHSAVRAYTIEGIPLLREPVAAGAGAGSMVFGSLPPGPEVSPATLLGLLNHQLYESTPAEKYATLFLGIYDGRQRQITYSNGGHLQPIILGEDQSMRRLDCGGTVVGLFDQMSYEEATVQLRRGEILLAYSDGVTEPENDFGEFGEERLIELVRDNRDLPLAKISEIVTAAVDDWIGGNEQPDDVTLVLARAR
jgi:sigma-B regulation protein RsbU (phosphoserine phosphatase)